MCWETKQIVHPVEAGFSHSPGPSLGSPKILFNEHTGGSFPGIKATGCETDHTRPRKTEVRNEWIYTTTLPHAYIPYTGTTLIFNFVVSLFYWSVLPKSVSNFHKTESSMPTYHVFLFPVLTKNAVTILFPTSVHYSLCTVLAK